VKQLRLGEPALNARIAELERELLAFKATAPSSSESRFQQLEVDD